MSLGYVRSNFNFILLLLMYLNHNLNTMFLESPHCSPIRLSLHIWNHMPPLARDFFHMELFASQIHFFELDNQLGSLNNNNSNLFLRSHPSQRPISCMRPPCCGTRDPPLCSNVIAKVYRGVHTLPPSGFESINS